MEGFDPSSSHRSLMALLLCSCELIEVLQAQGKKMFQASARACGTRCGLYAQTCLGTPTQGLWGCCVLFGARPLVLVLQSEE